MKHFLKKLSCALLAMLMLLTVTACGESGGKPADEVPEELKPYVIPWEKDVIAEAKEKGTMEFYFMASLGMDVGAEGSTEDPQKWGDSCLVVFPDGTTMLIDGGMPKYAPVLLQNLKKLGVEKLDYVMVSHQHNDHQGGLVFDGVMAQMEVGKVLYNGVLNAESTDPKRLEKFIEAHSLDSQVLKAGDKLTIGGVDIEILWPYEEEVGQMYDNATDLNNRSVVARFDHGEFSALFVGDLYKAGEADLIASAADKLDVDLVKIPHHGHKTSSSSEWGEAVSAQIAVGTGYVGMPNSQYYAYTKQGTRVMMDYMDGYIHITGHSDGTVDWEKSQERTSDFYAGLDKNAGITW